MEATAAHLLATLAEAREGKEIMRRNFFEEIIERIRKGVGDHTKKFARDLRRELSRTGRDIREFGLTEEGLTRIVKKHYRRLADEEQRWGQSHPDPGARKWHEENVAWFQEQGAVHRRRYCPRNYRTRRDHKLG